MAGAAAGERIGSLKGEWPAQPRRTASLRAERRVAGAAGVNSLAALSDERPARSRVEQCGAPDGGAVSA